MSTEKSELLVIFESKAQITLYRAETNDTGKVSDEKKTVHWRKYNW